MIRVENVVPLNSNQPLYNLTNPAGQWCLRPRHPLHEVSSSLGARHSLWNRAQPVARSRGVSTYTTLQRDAAVASRRQVAHYMKR